MKYCEKCKEEFENKKEKCRVCGTKLIDISDEKDEINEYEAAEIVSTMMITGIL